MMLSDAVTYNTIGYLYFPNFNMAIILLLAVPLSSILSVQLNVIISARVNDIRTANQLGLLLEIPFLGVYLMLVTNIASLNIINILAIITLLFLTVAAFFYLNKVTFQRDKILTQWK
jgi:hypothetical protein